jgi:glycosyltransferase involved in cell wall biosynthesis
VEFCQYTFAEMPDVYRRADIFSLASPDEAFGIVFIEAMASGLPALAHNGPRQRYVVAGGCVLCDVHNAGAYARTLASVVDAAPSENARAQAMQFDWRRIVADYDRLFPLLGQSSQ